MHFEPVPIRFEPAPNIFIFMIRRIVLNQHCAAMAVVATETLQESSIGRRIEDGILSVMKPGAPKFDCAEDLHILALTGDGNFGRTAYPTPCRM